MGLSSEMRSTVLSEKTSYQIIGPILAVALMARLMLIIFAQADAGDTSTYETFANNILNGCGMSQSNPSSNECILSSGGYFPGYPLFIACVWLLFGKSAYAVLLTQLACYLLAFYWLLVALIRLSRSFKVVFGVGMLLALSPLQVGWFRFILTEPLAIATATWFIAELINSISQKKLRVFHLALALSASIYIRPDAIFMALGAVVVAFYLHDIRGSIRHIAMFVALTSIPVSGWMIRNVLIGHAPLSIEVDPKSKTNLMPV